jgi:hypothetical protein
MISATLALALFSCQQPPTQTGQDAQTAALQAARALAQDPKTRRAYLSRDWMIGVAGNEVVLRSDLDVIITQSADLRGRWQNADAQGRQVIYEEALGQRLETLLRVQAGMDLGFDREVVDQRTDFAFDDRVERLGGHRAASKALQSDQLTPAQFRSHLRDQLLAMTWYQVQIGRAAGRTGRVFVDRNVRPGWIYSAYQAFSRSPSAEEQALVGKKEATYRLQILRVPVDPEGSPADSEALALELRRMYAEGEVSFDFLVRTYADPASQEKLGRLMPMTAQRAAQVAQTFHGPSGEAVIELLESGHAGNTTAPLFRTGPDSWLIYKLEGVEPGSDARPLSDPEVQQALQTFLLKAQDKSRERAAFAAVLSDSFIYPIAFEPFLSQRNAQSK